MVKNSYIYSIKKIRLDKVKIIGLFGKYDYLIDFASENDFLILYGINGCGKTTVLKILSDFSNGRILEILNIKFESLEILFLFDENQANTQKNTQNTKYSFQIKKMNKKKQISISLGDYGKNRYNYNHFDNHFFEALDKNVLSSEKQKLKVVFENYFENYFEKSENDNIKNKEIELNESNNNLKEFLNDIDIIKNQLIKEVEVIEYKLDMINFDIENNREKVEELEEEIKMLDKEIKKFEYLSDKAIGNADASDSINEYNGDYLNNIGMKSENKDAIDEIQDIIDELLEDAQNKQNEIDEIKNRIENIDSSIPNIIDKISKNNRELEELRSEGDDSIVLWKFNERELSSKENFDFFAKLLLLIHSFSSNFITTQRLTVTERDLKIFQKTLVRKQEEIKKQFLLKNIPNYQISTLSFDDIKFELTSSVIGEKANKMSKILTDERKMNDSLRSKISLFEQIMNEFLIYKELKTSKNKGFIIFDDYTIEIPLEKLSSGEINLIIMFFDLIFEKNNGFIMIDEPEISLHVSWQVFFIDSLKKIRDLHRTQDSKSLYFLIATHSPHIIQNRRDICYEPQIRKQSSK